MSATPLPEHLRRFPCMHPWIGSRYRDDRHKRLLVVGESHYLPPESTIHHDPDRWYRSSQAELSEEEVRWASTIGNITGRWTRAHRIYRANPGRDLPDTAGTRDHTGPLPPQPRRLLQLLPPPGADGRRQHGRQRMPAGSRRSRGSAAVVHPAPTPGTGDRHLTLRRAILLRTGCGRAVFRTSAHLTQAPVGGTRRPEVTETSEAGTCSPTSSSAGIGRQVEQPLNLTPLTD